MSYPQQAIDNILKQRRQPVNKRKTKNRQARTARPAVSVRRVGGNQDFVAVKIGFGGDVVGDAREMRYANAAPFLN